MAIWFSASETKGLRPRLVRLLDAARTIAGVPIVITAGKAKAGGPHKVHGSHPRGYGVDIRCASSRRRYLILAALFAVGFHRIGIYDRHIHADCDPTLPPQVVWMGKSK
jgi:hypothetical protein